MIDSIRFDIHLEKDIAGHRYIERVSEIVPKSNEQGYEIVDIVVFEENKYIFKNMFSENAAKEMQKRMTEMDRREFCAKYCIQI